MPPDRRHPRDRSPTPPPSHLRRDRPRTPPPPRHRRRRSPSPSRRSYSYRDDYRRRSRVEYDWDDRYARRYRRSDTPSPPPRRRRRSPSPYRYSGRQDRSRRTPPERFRSRDRMYTSTERHPIRFFKSSRDTTLSSPWGPPPPSFDSVPHGPSSFEFSRPRSNGSRPKGRVCDGLNIEEGDLGRSPMTAGGGAVKLKRKAPELVGGSKFDLGVIEKRMKQEAADAMDLEENEFDQRYNHGRKGGATRKRRTKNAHTRWKHDRFDSTPSDPPTPPETSSVRPTPASLEVHVGAGFEDPACKGMAAVRPDKEIGSTVVVSASDKARQFLDSMRLTQSFQFTADIKAAHEGEFKSGLEGGKVIVISPSASPSTVDEPTGFLHDGPLPAPAIPNRQVKREMLAASRPPPVYLGPLPSDLTRIELVSLLAPYDVADWEEMSQTKGQGPRAETMILKVEMKEDEGKEAIEFDVKEGLLRCREKVVKILDMEKGRREREKAEEQDKETRGTYFPATSAAFRLRGGGIHSDDSSTISNDKVENSTPDTAVDSLSHELKRTTRLESHVSEDPVTDDLLDETASSRIVLSPTPLGLTSPRSESIAFSSRSPTPASPRYRAPSHWVHPERVKSPWANLGEHDEDPYATREKAIEQAMDREVKVCIDRRREKIVRQRVETLDLTGDSDEEDGIRMSVISA